MVSSVAGASAARGVQAFTCDRFGALLRPELATPGFALPDAVHLTKCRGPVNNANGHFHAVKDFTSDTTSLLQLEDSRIGARWAELRECLANAKVLLNQAIEARLSQAQSSTNSTR